MKKFAVVALVMLLLGFGNLLAQQIDVPVRNWTVPPYTQASAGGGISTMTDVGPPRAFVAVAPCRLADTRGIDGFSGQAGGPGLNSFVNRDFQITGSPAGVPAPPFGCPAGTIPAGAEAVSVQFTVVFPSAAGNLVAWQAGGSIPNVSVLNWDAGTVALGNGTIVPLSAGGAITARLNTAAGGQSSQLIIDVNGYFSDNLGTTTNNFLISSTSSAYAIFGSNDGTGYGVRGFTVSTGLGGAGVYGEQSFMFLGEVYNAAGVRGQGPSTGVLGVSPNEAVTGGLVTPAGVDRGFGILGFNTGPAAAQAFGVYYGGNLGGSGTKSFIEPHPTDSSKVIQYISLEGAEPGTYFRGKGKFERGTARITVPEDFRMVTDAEGLTVQITPIGGMASVGVMKADLNEIVVQSSRNLEFYYLVNGIRRSHKHLTSPIVEGTHFMPRFPTSKMPAYLTDDQKQMLIQNGTYKADGTVNMETAHRNGWDRIWAERERPTPAPSPE
jgi:hypothetical protein